MPDRRQPPEPPFANFPTATQPPPAPVRVVVADDNPVVRAGLTALLSGREDITVVGEAADGREAYETARRHRPDVILLDVRMPGVDGISALPYLVPIAPVMMLTYSGEPEIVQEALRLGADGYLVHGEFTTDQLVGAVRDIRVGRAHFTPTAAGALLARLREGVSTGATAYENAEPPIPTSPISPQRLSQLQPTVRQSSSDRSRFQLSAREAEIMDFIASGMNNQQIAATCFISEKTVKNHINRIFAKLHSTSRSQAAAKWLGTAPSSSRGLG
ncbi:response regulator [Streptomyces fulvoviolaceus]|uniref:response regulator n=1 Tax=Streptomyces fulvoviolaceus TaxID=285535 RepID=UPI0004CAC4A6|nr:response regulator transcription factor [Streptomyces fulvoviolaceus]MCT9081126.1 response regulator transcription factor [Streptomyces fulvoviolaceus]